MALPNEEMDLARYKTASAELDSPSRDEGLWIKAFAESGGVENASRAMYIKLRVEQLRRSAVADAARRVVSESVAAPKVGGSLPGASQTPAQAPSPPPIAPQGPARVSQTLYDIIGVSRHAGAATITAAIQAKTTQRDDSSAPPEERQRREILLQNAAEVLLNVDKRRSYDERVFKVEAVAPTAAKNVEPPRAAYVAPPVSGMTEEEGVEDVPSTGKKWAAYVGWFVVWVCILGVLSAPLTKVPLGAILGAIVAFCNIAILVYGILLIRQKFKVASSEGVRKNWIILCISILVLLGLRLSIGGGRQLDATRAESNARAADGNWVKELENENVTILVDRDSVSDVDSQIKRADFRIVGRKLTGASFGQPNMFLRYMEETRLTNCSTRTQTLTRRVLFGEEGGQQVSREFTFSNQPEISGEDFLLGMKLMCGR